MVANKRQEINLYLPSLRPSRDPLQPILAGIYLLAALLILSVMAVVDVFQNRSLQQEIALLQTQQQQLQSEADAIKAQLPKSRAKQLDKAIEEMRLQVERRQRIKGLVDAQNLGNAQGFSSQMVGMARQLQPGLALQAFTLSDGGAQVGFAGQVREAATVPRYIEKLQSEAAFTASQFGVMNIARQEDSALLAFNLSPESQNATATGGTAQ